MSIEHERMREDGQTSAEADQHEIEQAYNMTPNQDQAEAERVARETLEAWYQSKILADGFMRVELTNVLAAALLAAKESGKRSRDDEVSKLVGKIDDLRSECLRAYSNGD